MSQYFELHTEDPQLRLLRQAAEVLRGGGLIAYPTDSGYALGCAIGDKTAQDRMRRLRELDDKHHFTLMCRDLSELSIYARVENTAVFRLLKNNTPGAYTFILKATQEVPRRLMNPKRKTLGLRVPDNAIALGLLAEMGEPILSCSLILPGTTETLTDPEDIRERLSRQVDLILAGGCCGTEPTTVVDLTEGSPEVTRVGSGDPAPFE